MVDDLRLPRRSAEVTGRVHVPAALPNLRWSDDLPLTVAGRDLAQLGEVSRARPATGYGVDEAKGKRSSGRSRAPAGAVHRLEHHAVHFARVLDDLAELAVDLDLPSVILGVDDRIGERRHDSIDLAIAHSGSAGVTPQFRTSRRAIAPVTSSASFHALGLRPQNHPVGGLSELDLVEEVLA